VRRETVDTLHSRGSVESSLERRRFGPRAVTPNLRSTPRHLNQRAVFLDVDGVLLDPELTPLEWNRLMGEVLAPAIGGTPADWGHANAAVFPRLFAARERWYDADPLVTERRFITLMLEEQCDFLGLARVAEEDAFRLGRELDAHVYRHARCAYPAAVAVIRELAAEREVHAATGNPSWRVEALLEQWGVRDLVGVLPGVDLVGVQKDSEAFYPAVFELAGVATDRAVVVDDVESHLARARRAGARTVLVGPGAASEQADAVIGNVADLPATLRRLG